MKLEDLLNKSKQPDNIEFKSPGVFTKEQTSYGIRYNSPIDVIIDDGGISSNKQIELLEELLEGLEPSINNNMASLLEPTPNQVIPDFNPIEQSTTDVATSVNIPDYLLNDPEVVGYPDVDMQEEIYKWVSSSIPWSGYTIKDLGAGRGDFYGHLIRLRDNVTPHYVGFESKESLVLAGRQKYPNIELIHGDYLNSDVQTDYTICIGTLNENHGFDKWEYFNKTLKHCIYTTKKAIIFILSKNMDGNSGFLDYNFNELFDNLPSDARFTIDYTRMEDIYKLTVHIGGYN